MTIDLRNKAGNLTIERKVEKGIAREINAEVNRTLNLSGDRCLTMSEIRFRRGNLWMSGL